MRTIQDEDRRRRDDREPVTLPGVRCIRETAHAILCVIDGRDVWIPQSQVHDNSEVFEQGHEGKLVITAWCAEQKGLAL